MVDAIRDALEVLRRAVLAGFDRLCPESQTETPLESARAAAGDIAEIRHPAAGAPGRPIRFTRRLDDRRVITESL
jgi:hypothetical protein